MFSGRITADESLFTYKNDWDTNSFTDLDFQPDFLSLNSVNQSIIDNCDENPLCIYDTLLTGNPEIGQYTNDVVREVENKTKALGQTSLRF